MQRWTESITRAAPLRPDTSKPHPIGLLPGEGIGPELTRIAEVVVSALGDLAPVTTSRAVVPWKPTAEDAISPGIADFCSETFAAGGAILAGPYGGRFVYEFRRRFDLFCKLNPIRPSPALKDAACVRPELLARTDILVVRENTGGVYQGTWDESTTASGERIAEHRFSYTEGQVRRVLDVSVRLAAGRRGSLVVVVKPGGVPSISRLWCDCAAEVARKTGVTWKPLEIDCAAYRLIQHPEDFDVVVAPNLAADVLCDLGAVLLGSRGLSFGASYAASGAAVYQTNHGAAFDLAGADRANPVGHLLALAMLLRESFALSAAADALEAGIEAVWTEGWRTEDLAERGGNVIGTAEMGERIAAAVGREAERRAGHGVA